METVKTAVVGVDESQVEVGDIEDVRCGEEEGTPSSVLSHEVGGREQEGSEVEGDDDLPGAEPEPADAAGEEQKGDWRGRAEAAEERVAELGDRLGAVEAAAEDLRRIVVESERGRQVDRELLIAGVVDLDGARALVEEQVATGATVVEAVARVKERRPLLFVARARGIRATVLPAVEGERGRSVEEVAEAARETGDRRLLLRYLRMRRGDRD